MGTLAKRAKSMEVFKSVNDILRFALAKEQATKQFYLDLSKIVHDQATQAIFKALANEESKHETAIELELIKIGKIVKPFHYNLSDEIASDLSQINESTKNMTVLDALKLAMDKERTSFQLFTDMMSLTEDRESKEIFYHLAEQEIRHLIRLETEYEALSPKQNKSI